ncbi:TetR/AcrR family transcriptional regulator [Nonomuraea sp. NPDC003707]
MSGKSALGRSRGGYRGGSLREIAKQLDLSLTSVVHHFPSKSALLVAVLENADSAHVDTSSGLDVTLVACDHPGHVIDQKGPCRVGALPRSVREDRRAGPTEL